MVKNRLLVLTHSKFLLSQKHPQNTTKPSQKPHIMMLRARKTEDSKCQKIKNKKLTLKKFVLKRKTLYLQSCLQPTPCKKTFFIT